jgi:hypothetical protein
MDLEAETTAYEAEVEKVRAVVDTFAAAYAKAMTAVAKMTGSVDQAHAKFGAHARQINAEAARRGLPAPVTVPDLGGEVDLALVLRGVELPPGMTFTALMRRAGDAHG